jgi:hypothetical protein
MAEGRQSFEERAVIGRVLRLKQEIESFEARWPTSGRRDESIPTFTWDQLERQLTDLAATPAQESMVRHLVSATRKMAPFKPAEMVLREVLCMTWVLLDENFRPDGDSEPPETT